MGDLVVTKGLEVASKEAMVDALLAHEAKIREDLRMQKVLAEEVENKIIQELSARTNPELKELCSAKGLKMGGGKDEKIERLAQAARNDGEIDQELLSMARASRRKELAAMEKSALKTLCDQAGIDLLMKDVMVERVMMNEFDMPLEHLDKKFRKA